MPYGLMFSIAGAAVAAALAGVGSVLGVSSAGQSSAGLVSEDPDKFGKVLLLTALPGTQGIYGFLAAIIIVNKVGLLGGEPLVDMTIAEGLQVFVAALPIALTGLFSGAYQGRVSAAAVNITAKKPDSAGKGVILSAIVETYAVLGLLVTILIVNSLQF